jgi:hypothetical protein
VLSLLAVPASEPWGPEQALGAPDTFEVDFIHTAWSPLEPDSGEEWLAVTFARPVAVAELRIRQTLNPGTIRRVTALLEKNRERTLWEGRAPVLAAPADLVVVPERQVVARRFAIYLDTARRQGFEGIDAVELVGRDGSRQWSEEAAASSSYATMGGLLAWELSEEVRNFDDRKHRFKGRAPGYWIRANPALLSAPGDILRAWTLDGASTIVISRWRTDAAWSPGDLLARIASALELFDALVLVREVQEVSGLQATSLVAMSGETPERVTLHWVAIPREGDVLLILLSAPEADFATGERVFRRMLAALEVGGARGDWAREVHCSGMARALARFSPREGRE